ncbi:outer membrane protein TOM13-domain-containing protein [Dichotomopilus funicola]|uniref:Outer membrane protein TOM13-domain-containing protein n=1 Tax=Dichotomopilus funicola TaxID=1934379 RepID=A0AAN6ZKI5_9PEZI|nr:outer membrane protein TOM13-domain-containing protein [Dichotomopilus funicola]
MSVEEPPNPLAESGVTIRSDSEQYSRHEDSSVSPPSSSSPAVVLYQPPTLWSIFRGAAINIFLPFINGMMLGFGELFAHEAAFRLGWSNTRPNIRQTPQRACKMLPSRSLFRFGPAPGLSRARQFSTALRTNDAVLRNTTTSGRIRGPAILAATSQPLLLSQRQARNASTQATTTVPPTDAVDLTNFSGTPVNLTGSDLLDIPEQIGFLKTLGLDYGWGPTSFMQTVLESVYVYTGLPWWASMAIVAVGIRVALFKPTLIASENAIKFQELQKDPEYAGAMEEMKRLMVNGNHIAGASARAKVSLMNKKAGYSIFKNLYPMLQIPLGIGMFRLTQGMAALPVPSFETGGFLWFTDLAASDPLFIMPIITGLLMAWSMRIPLKYMAPQQQKISRIMSLIIMPISTGVALFFPAGTTWFFFLSSLLHGTQTYVLHQGWFRRMVGLPPLSAPSSAPRVAWHAPRVLNVAAPRVKGSQTAKSAPAAGSQSIYQSLMTSINDAKGMTNARMDKNAGERSAKAAKEYQDRRALEEKERLVSRLQSKKMKGY